MAALRSHASTGSDALLVRLVRQHRHRRDPDAFLQQRLDLGEIGLAADRALRLVAGVDGARDLRERLADVVGARLDLAPQRRAAPRAIAWRLLVAAARRARRRAPRLTIAGAIGALAMRGESQSGQVTKPRRACSS